jgi:thioester reductase-like protein
MGSIISALDIRIAEHPDKLLYSFLDKKGGVKESYTYREFDEKTNRVASYLSENYEFKPGDRIILAYPPGLESICSFFACVKLGLIPVPVYPPSSQNFQSSIEKMNFIAQDCGAIAILTERLFYWSLKVNLTRLKFANVKIENSTVVNLPWIVSAGSGRSGKRDFVRAHSDLLFIQYTSGSTSNPKGVMVSHDNIIYNGECVMDHTPIGVSWLPQYHDMGLIGYYLNFAIKGGTTYGFSPIDFIQRPALWLETISKYKATAISAPSFAFSYCLSPGKIPESTYKDLDLSSLQCVMNAAEPIDTSVYKAFIDFYSKYGLKAQSCFAAYGLAEFTLAVSCYGRKFLNVNRELLKQKRVEEVQSGGVSIMSCGVPLRDTEIVIVDVPSGRVLENDRVGEIWLNGSSKSLGYWGKPDLSKDVFQAETAKADGRWLKTGDLGFMHKGELFVCGRTKDMIIIRGVNYYPQDVERLVEQDSRVRKGCVAAFSIDHEGEEQLVVVAEVKNKSRLPDVGELTEKITNYLGLRPSKFVFTSPRSISRTSSGKIMRHMNRERYLNSTHKVVESVEVDATKKVGVSKIIFFTSYGLSGEEQFSLAEAGLDSMKLAEFAHDLKSHVSSLGYEDLSGDIELKLLQKIAVSELHSILLELEDAGIAAKLRFRKAFAIINDEFEVVEREMMKSDALLEAVEVDEINTLLPQGSGDVLLTGGTGFFGPFILKSILDQTSQDVYVLVRGESEKAAMDRLKESFEIISPSEVLKSSFKSRVRVVRGDISKSQLGLTDVVWDELSENISTIYNNGALVNYLLDYESMREVNSCGTVEIIRLALTKRIKTFNHISTTFIFGWSMKDTLNEVDENLDMENLDFGYSQSKWVSEQIVKRAMKRGLKARIFRPALISPSIDGKGYNYDIAIRLLAFMLKHKLGTSAKNQISFTPADISANNVVAISNIEDSINKVFHVTSDTYSNLEDVTNIFTAMTGEAFEILSNNDFVPEIVNRCTKEDILFPLISFLIKSDEKIRNMEFKLYDNSNYRKYRAMSEWGVEDKPLEEVVYGILKFMSDNEIISYQIKEVSHV